MKEKYNKISTANVNEMEKDQLDEFSKEVEEFKSKTKFLRNGTLLKTLYMVFGYFFGIVGMIISTPLMSIIKIILTFINEKYDIISISND